MKPEHLSTPWAIVSAPWLGIDGYCMATCCTAMKLLLPHDLLHAHLNANAPEGGESRALHFGGSAGLFTYFLNEYGPREFATPTGGGKAEKRIQLQRPRQLAFPALDFHFLPVEAAAAAAAIAIRNSSSSNKKPSNAATNWYNS